MSPAQERVIRSVADALGMADLRTFRAYLEDTDMSYYDVLKVVYGE